MRHFVLLLVAAGIVTFASCCPEQEQKTFTIEIQTLTPKNYDYQNFEVIETPTVPYTSYSIVLETTATGLENASPGRGTGGILISPDCDEPFPDILLEDGIADISVTASEELNAGFPAGSELKTLFNFILINTNPMAAQPDIQYEANGIDLEEMQAHFALHHSTIDYLEQDPFLFYGLKLLAMPDRPVTLTFEVTITFQSGKSLTGTTDSITLQP